jgi:hypothetical protein
MADDAPTRARSSVLNPNKSQTARGKQVNNASTRSKVVTRPRTLLLSFSLFCRTSNFVCPTAWAKNEPPSPTDSHLELPPSLGGTYGLPDARRSDLSQNSTAGPSGEQRWFPFTRRRPTLSSEVFGAEPSLERRPTILGFTHRQDRSPPLGEKSFEQAPSRSPDRGLRIALPTTPAPPFTLSHGRTPGWDSPWTARPLESFPHLNVYEQLQNGDSSEEQGSTGSWSRARKRARVYLLNNTYVPLVKHTLMDLAEAH